MNRYVGAGAASLENDKSQLVPILVFRIASIIITSQSPISLLTIS